MGGTYLLLTLLLVLEVHIKGGRVPLVGVEASEFGQLLAVLGVFNGAQLDDGTIDPLDFLPFFGVLLLNFLQKLDETLEDDALELLQEPVRLKSLTGDIERKVIGCHEISAEGFPNDQA